jgi:hypothetical protein
MIEAGHSPFAVRLRTGLSVRVIDMAQDGLLVETTARLLPGHPVDLVLDTGGAQVSVRGLVVSGGTRAGRENQLLAHGSSRGVEGTNYSRRIQCVSLQRLRGPVGPLAPSWHTSWIGTVT